MALPTKRVISVKEAVKLWEKFHNGQQTLLTPDDKYLYKMLPRHEGVLCYRAQGGSWRIYEDVFTEYITHGFPDPELKLPILTLPAALRYLYKNGVTRQYKLRELRADLEERRMIKRFPGKVKPYLRVTRSHLNKFLGEWNGNR